MTYNTTLYTTPTIGILINNFGGGVFDVGVVFVCVCCAVVGRVARVGGGGVVLLLGFQFVVNGIPR